jgi:hypothetical protein
VPAAPWRGNDADRGRIALSDRARRHGARQDHRHRGARRRGRRARRLRPRRREGNATPGRRDRVRRRPAEARRATVTRLRSLLEAASPRRVRVARAGHRRHRRSRAGRAPARGRGFAAAKLDARVAWTQVPGVPPGGHRFDPTRATPPLLASAREHRGCRAGTPDEHRVSARTADNDIETSLAGARRRNDAVAGAMEAFRRRAADVRPRRPQAGSARSRRASPRRACVSPMASSASMTAGRAADHTHGAFTGVPVRGRTFVARGAHDRRRVRRGLADLGDPPRRHDSIRCNAAMHNDAARHVARGALIASRASTRRVLHKRRDDGSATLAPRGGRHAGARDRAFAHRRAGHASRRRRHRALRRRVAVACCRNRGSHRRDRGRTPAGGARGERTLDAGRVGKIAGEGCADALQWACTSARAFSATIDLGAVIRSTARGRRHVP